MDAELSELIRRSPLFGGQSAEVAERLLAASRIQSYAKGAAVFHQGDPAMAIGLVVSGWMKLFRMSAGGNEAVVRMFSAGESFGEAVALRGSAYPASHWGAHSDAIIIRKPLPCGSLVAASGPASRSARPTSLDLMSSIARCMSATSRRRSYTAWASIISG